MSNKGFSKLVIAAGMVLILIGFNMDVSVSTGYGRVANIHLLGQQQLFVMLGGFIFLGGLILFAVARIKQTREDEAKEIETKNKQTEDILQKGRHISSTASDLAVRSSESALRLGKQAYAQGKGKLKIAAYVIGVVLILLVILGQYAETKEQNRLAEVAKNEADRARMEEEFAKAEHGRRLQFFKQEFSSGKFFGYALGDRNLKQLVDQFGSQSDKNKTTERVKCEGAQCNVLAGYAAFAPALDSVQFEYCTGGTTPAIDDGSLGNYMLTKIELFYKNGDAAKADFDALKKESYDFKQLDAETTESIELMSYIISISRKRGKWDVCGN